MVGVAVTTVGSTTSAHLRHTNEPEVLAMNLTAAHTAPVAKKPWYRQLYFYVLVAIVLGDGVNADVSSLKPSEDVGTLVQAGEESHWWDFVLRVLPESFVGPFVEGQILQIIFLAVVFGIALNAVGPVGVPGLSGVQRLTAVVFKVLAFFMKAAPSARSVPWRMRSASTAWRR
jgi:Na+/H+-dicarboxylate symporter